MAPMRRPDGITLLSVLLGVMALCGLVNALVWNASIVRELVLKASPADADWLGGPVFTVLMLAYAASSAASAFALWRLRSWAVWAYVGWCASMGAAVAWFRLQDGPEELRTANAVMGLLASAVFLVVCPYIARHTRAASVPATN